MNEEHHPLDNRQENVGFTLQVLQVGKAIGAMSVQQLRIAKILAKQAHSKQHAGTSEEERLFSLCCNAIQSGVCSLIILMPTHDGDTRAPERGIAYFDPLVAFPDRHCTYPGEPQVKDSPHITYRSKGATGGMKENGTLLELLNPDKMTDGELIKFLIQEISPHLLEEPLMARGGRCALPLTTGSV